jgi:hypothetical protein
MADLSGRFSGSAPRPRGLRRSLVDPSPPDVCTECRGGVSSDDEFSNRDSGCLGRRVFTADGASVRTVWPTTRRLGSWYNLDVCYYLGAGAASDAKRRSQRAFGDLEAGSTGLPWALWLHRILRRRRSLRLAQ